jgi:predicted ester cyclase
MSTETNKLVVQRFFEECIDGGNSKLVAELFAPNCVIYRPELDTPMIGVDAVTKFVEGVADLFDEVRTELHLIFAEDDYVATRLSHNVVFKQDWVTRLGSHHVIGKPVDWAANVIFKFSGDKIIEEWIERDELSMHYKLGLLAS